MIAAPGSVMLSLPDLTVDRWYWVLVLYPRTDLIVTADSDDPDAWTPLKWTDRGWSNEDCWAGGGADIVGWKLIPLATELP